MKQLSVTAQHGGAVTYAINSGDDGGTGATVTPAGELRVPKAGTVKVTATEAETANYLAAVTVVTVTVGKGAGTTSTGTPVSFTYGSTMAVPSVSAQHSGTIAWSVKDDDSNTAKLAVADGKISAAQAGKGTIMATESSHDYEDVVTTFAVTVNKGTLPDLKPKDVELDAGSSSNENTAATLKAKPGFITGTTLAYSSSDSSIATVDSDGQVKGVKGGSATITVTETSDNYTDKTESFKVTVKDVVVVTLAHSGTAIASPGSAAWSSTPLTATITMNGQPAPDDEVIFTSTPSIAIHESSNDTDGSFTRRSSGGTAVINIESKTAGDYELQASYKGKTSAKLKVAFGKYTPVLQKPADITQNWAPNLTLTTSGEGVGSANGAGDWTYSSSDQSVVGNDDISITNQGHVSMKVHKAGTATITVGTKETDSAYAQSTRFAVTVNKGTLPDLQPKDVELDAGSSSSENTAATLKAKPGFITGTTLAYSSSDSSIATVDSDGQVKGVKGGSATITVTETSDNYTDKTESFKVTVKDVVVVTLAHSGTAIASAMPNVWSHTPLTATITMNGQPAPDDEVIFTSTPAIAIHESPNDTDTSFKMRSSNGQAVIGIESKTARSYDLQASYKGKKSATVNVTFGKYTPVLLKPADITHDWSPNLTLNADVGSANGAGDWTYSSSDQSVVRNEDITISHEGRVFIKVQKAGTTTISVGTKATESASAQSTSFTVTVNKAAVSAAAMSDSVKVGETKTLSVTAQHGGPLTYAINSGDDGTTGATVTRSGELSVSHPGSVKVTATEAETANYQAAVTVVTVTVAKGAGASSSGTPMSFTYGDTATLPSVSAQHSGTIAWSVKDDDSNTAKLAVADGKISAVHAGSGTIIATESSQDYENVVTTFAITVNKATLPNLNPKNVELDVGSTSSTNSADSLGAKSGTALTYSSSDTDIATVDSDGKVKGVQAGSATITVTEKLANYTDKEESFTVTVKRPIPPVSTSWRDSGSTHVLQVNGVSVTFSGGDFASGERVTFSASGSATLNASGSWKDAGESATTSMDSHGKASVNVSDSVAETVTITATVKGQTYSHDINFERPTEPSVHLSLDNVDTASAGYDYQWRNVYIKVDNAPAGTAVTVNNKDHAMTGKGSGTFELTTDSNGEATFRVQAFVGRQYRFTAKVPHSSDSNEVTVELNRGAQVDNIQVSLVIGNANSSSGVEVTTNDWVTLTATVKKNGTPLSNVDVQFTNQGDGAGTETGLTRSTDSNGHATLRAFPKDANHLYNFTAVYGGVTSNTVTMKFNLPRPRLFKMDCSVTNHNGEVHWYDSDKLPKDAEIVFRTETGAETAYRVTDNATSSLQKRQDWTFHVFFRYHGVEGPKVNIRFVGNLSCSVEGPNDE